MDLIPTELQAGGLASVGRLDLDTTGLILLTTDGELAHRLMSPKYQVENVPSALSRQAIYGYRQRTIPAGHQIGRPDCRFAAELEILAGNAVQLKITEGKYHQVKRCFWLPAEK